MQSPLLKKICFTLLLCFLGACSSADKSAESPAAENTSASTTQSTAQPPVEVSSLTPPAIKSNEDLNDGAAFFQRKETWDSFSPRLKESILKSYSEPSAKQGTTYETLFGKVVIEEKPEVEKYEKITMLGLEDSSDLITRNFAIMADDPCATGASFLCISLPSTETSGVVVDAFRIQGAVKMAEVASFSATDPIIMVSVFKKDAAGLFQRAGDFPVLLSDIVPHRYQPARAAGADRDPDPIEVGPFNKIVPLSGPGVYQIVIIAWKDTGDSVQPEARRFTVYRQSVPQFAANGVRVFPGRRGNSEGVCDLANPINISMSGTSVDFADICIEAVLADQGTPNVGVIVENYRRDAMGQMVLSYAGSGDQQTSSQANSNRPVITTLVPLHAGLNHFKVKVRNSMLADSPLPEAALKEFELIQNHSVHRLNFSPTSVVDGKVIETRNASTPINLEFCVARGGACVTNWPPAAKPEIFVNGIKLATARVTQNAGGYFIASFRPLVGMNTFNITVPVNGTISIPEYKAAFAFGKVNKLYEGGQLKETDNFLKRGLSLAIGANVIRNDVKTILSNFLNSADFKASLHTALASDDTGSRVACDETFFNDNPGQRELNISAGDTSIELLEEGLQVGDFDIQRFETTPDNRLALSLVLRGLRGEVNLRGLRTAGRVVIGGRDLSFIPLTLTIAELRVKVAVKFVKNASGVQELEIERMADDVPPVEIIGNDAFGKYLHVNTNRNPLAATLEQYEQQTGAFSMQFRKGIEATLLCGTETNLNHRSTGLGQWLSDVLKIVSYNNQNPFRAAFQFDMLGKQVGVDIAYDFLRSQNIAFNEQGIQITNMPLRVTPGPVSLASVPEAIRNSLIGSISAPDLSSEPSPAALPTTDIMNLSLKLSEEVINQALFAASFAGLLDVDIDPNFFTNNEIGFIGAFTPVVNKMIGVPSDKFFDLNQNGVNDDENLPVRLSLKTNKQLAPSLRFLSQEEVNELANGFEESINQGAAAGTARTTLNRDLKYFRFVLPDLEISVFQVQPVSAENGGYKTFCSRKTSAAPQGLNEAPESVELPPIYKLGENPSDANQGHACRQVAAADYAPSGGGLCAEDFDPFTTPIRNGSVVSAVPGVENVPVVKYKATLSFYGVLQGVYREPLIGDMYRVTPQPNAPALFEAIPNPPASNFVRMRVLTKGSTAPKFDMKVIENRLPIAGEDLVASNNFNQVVAVALGRDCQFFNEITIPLPDRFVDDPAVEGDFMEKMAQFGISSIDLGDEESELPTVSTDSSGLYLDLTAHLGLGRFVMLSPEVLTNVAIQEILRNQNSRQ